MAAPFDPLPFDPRTACQCHARCPDHVKPTTRIWVSIPAAPPPFEDLADGILMLIGVIGPGPPDLCGPGQNCAYVPASLPPPLNSAFFCRLLNPAMSLTGYDWRIIFKLTGFGDYIAIINASGFSCRANHTLFKVQGPAVLGDAKMTQVRWFQNANDVPH